MRVFFESCPIEPSVLRGARKKQATKKKNLHIYSYPDEYDEFYFESD